MSADWKFVFVVPLFNDERWIAESVNLVRRQSDAKFVCWLIDDLSTDRTVEVARDATAGDDRFRVLVNEEKKFSLRNVADGIRAAEPESKDVIVLLDGDDRLADDEVLSTLRSVYAATDCLLTYGSYADEEGVRNPECLPYTDDVIRRRAYRRARWRASHLKTFRYGLWRNLDQRWLRITAAELDAAKSRALLTLQWRYYRRWRGLNLAQIHEPSGQYVRRCVDKVMMFPLLELAGERSRFVERVLYIHRKSGKQANPYGSSDLAPRWMNRLIRQVLKQRSPLESLSDPV